MLVIGPVWQPGPTQSVFYAPFNLREEFKEFSGTCKDQWEGIMKRWDPGLMKPI
jgi:hypothetical protein